MGYTASRYNRLKHGAMLHVILPSRGPDHCPLAGGCPVAEEEDLRHLCVPGEPCHWESWFLYRYVHDGRKHYQRCLEWMSEATRDNHLHELALLHLRRNRVSGLVAREGLLRDKKHPISGYVYGREMSLGIGRYATAIDTLYWPLMHELIYSPQERAMMEYEARREREEIVLPSMLSARPEPPEPANDPPAEPFLNPTAGWFDLPKPWDHEPGKPNTG